MTVALADALGPYFGGKTPTIGRFSGGDNNDGRLEGLIPEKQGPAPHPDKALRVLDCAEVLHGLNDGKKNRAVVFKDRVVGSTTASSET